MSDIGVGEAIRIAELWREGKMVGGDEDEVRDALLGEVERLRAENEALRKDAEQYTWQPIETAPKDNQRPLLLADFDAAGRLKALDYDGAWRCERESWEIPQVYYYWSSAWGYVEEPTHWMYQPEWFATLAATEKGE